MKKHMRHFFTVVAVMLSLAIFTACTPTDNTLFTVNTYPKVDGSTANLPLMAQYMAETCGISVEEAETLVVASTTPNAWYNLANENVDLLIVYEASAETIASIQNEYENLEITPIGRDGLVFLVNTDNPVQSLTQEELINIYTGNITNWNEVGGNDAEIVPFQRSVGSGSQTLFLKLLMKDVPPMEAPTELAPGGMGQLIDMLAEFDGSGPAIGYSVYYYAHNMYTDPNVRMIGVDGIQPTNETLADGSYPFTNDFYVVIRSDEPEDSAARQLRDWILSDEGREALVAAGYVPAF